MAGGLALVVNIVGDARKLNAALGESDKKVQAFGKSLDIGGIAKAAAFAGGVTLAAGAIVEMTSAAAADRDEQRRLMTAIEAAGAAHGDYAAQVDEAIAAGQAKAFTDTQTREALQSLVTATGDVTAATGLLSTAQDVARFAGVDLATASDAIAKAQAGNDGALRKLIPGLAKGATATETMANAQKAAAGQADAFAKSTEGQTAIASDAFGELAETIGETFLPILDAILPALIPVIQSLGKLIKAVLPILIPLMRTLAQVLGIVAGWLVKVADFLVDMVTAAQNAARAIQRFVDNLPDFPTLPSFGGQAAPTATGLGVNALGASRAATGGGGITVNIYGGDPTRVEAAVAKALRGYTRRNGSLGLVGMTGRGTVGA